MISKILRLLILLILVSSSLAAQGKLKILVSGIDPERGSTMALALYADKESYKAKEPLQSYQEQLPAGESTFEFILTDLETGELMILGLQDANGNLDMDTGLFGIPKEGFFCSHNAGIPSWDKCVFAYDGEDVLIRLEMVYW